MSSLKYLLITLLSVFSGSLASAQNNTSIVAGADSTGRQIIVKWFGEQVLFPQGVNVYRSVSGNKWEKLTARPLKKGDIPVPKAIMDRDSSMQSFVEAARSATAADLKSIVGAMMMVKAVQSNDFARYLGLCYADASVATGNTYRYRVTRLQSGQEVTVGETAPVLAGDYRPVAPPEGLTVKPGDTESQIRWTPEPGRFFGVNIYRTSNRDSRPVKANRDMILISKQENAKGVEAYPDIFFTDKQLNNHYQYTYFLRAVDYLGYEGTPGEPVTVAPRDQTPPEPPQNMKLAVDGLVVNITWQGPSAPSPDMAGYHVYRSKRINNGYLRANSALLAGSTLTYTDRTPAPGEYFYYVASVDSAGNEGHSFKDMADVKDVYPPAAPRGLVAQSDSGRITLHWAANTESDLMGYQVFRTVEKDNPAYYVLLNKDPLTTTEFTDKLPAVSKNKFHYKVAAIDSALNRSEYSDPIFGVMPDLTPPTRPFIKKITQQENALLVEWIPNVEADLKAYHVYRMSLNDSAVQRLNPKPVSREVNRFTDYLVQPGAAYRYYITATDSANNVSSPSEYFYATFVQDESPERSSPVVSFKVSHKPGQKSAGLRWKLKDEPACKGAIVFRKEDATFVPVTGLLQSIDFSDREIVEGRRYTYRLHVFLESGEVFKSEEIAIEVKPKK